jgi:hypothetical protein
VVMSERYQGTILSSSYTWKDPKPFPGVSWSILTPETNKFDTIARCKPLHHPVGHQKGEQSINLHSSQQMPTKVWGDDRKMEGGRHHLP